METLLGGVWDVLLMTLWFSLAPSVNVGGLAVGGSCTLRRFLFVCQSENHAGGIVLRAAAP